MIGRIGKKVGNIKKMLRMTLNGKRTDVSFSEKMVTDGG